MSEVKFQGFPYQFQGISAASRRRDFLADMDAALTSLGVGLPADPCSSPWTVGLVDLSMAIPGPGLVFVGRPVRVQHATDRTLCLAFPLPIGAVPKLTVVDGAGGDWTREVHVLTASELSFRFDPGGPAVEACFAFLLRWNLPQ